MGWQSVETRCPDCSKRLRLPETYSGQRIRCRNCGSVFRPVERDLQGAIEVPYAAAADEVSPRSAPAPSPARSPRPTATRSRGGGGGFGIAIIIGIVLFRGIPGLFKMLGDKDRRKLAPVEIRDEDLHELQDALRQLEKQPKADAGDDLEGGLLDPNEPPGDVDEARGSRAPLPRRS